MAVTSYADLKKDIKRRMDSALDVLKKEFAGLRTGRASTNLIEPVMVDAYGSMMPINQLGNIGVPEPRLITVQVWDKGMVKAVEKAIRDAGLGPQSGRRRTVGAHSGARAQRRTPPGIAEDRRQICRTGADFGAQCAPRRHGSAEEARKKTAHITQDEHRHNDKEVQALHRRDDQARRRGAGASKTRKSCRSDRWRPYKPNRSRLPRFMSRSSWTATGAGRRRAACPVSPAISAAPTRYAKPSAPPANWAWPI